MTKLSDFSSKVKDQTKSEQLGVKQYLVVATKIIHSLPPRFKIRRQS